MKKIKTLHLASFAGNIGDIANHQSFYRQLNKMENFNFEIKELEMRDFYKNSQIKRFDKKFVEYVNKFDLFIIGGGNFFELCWDYSSTGTTFDINFELLKEIKTPIIINAIGIDDNKGTNDINIEKFRIFLHTLFTFNKVHFTVRNDGSFDIVKKYFNEYTKSIHPCPDWGFILNEVEILDKYKMDATKQNSIGFNIAVDMASLRYKEIGYEEFVYYVSEQINRILVDSNYNVMLFPHIQTDLIVINDILRQLDKRLVRSKVSIAPLIQGKELEGFKLFKECKMIFAMRFHSNVCAIALGIPTFGILSYPKHNQLYEQLKIPHRKVDINEECFNAKFTLEIDNIIHFGEEYFIELKREYNHVKVFIDNEVYVALNKLNEFLRRVIKSE